MSEHLDSHCQNLDSFIVVHSFLIIIDNYDDSESARIHGGICWGLQLISLFITLLTTQQKLRSCKNKNKLII